MEPIAYHRELEQLECQRARLLDLLIHDDLSPDLVKHLRSLLDDVLIRMLTLQAEHRSHLGDNHFGIHQNQAG